VSINRIR